MTFKFAKRKHSKPLYCDDDSTYSTAKALPSKTPVINSETPGKDSNFGTNAVIKTFYEHNKKGWSETPPKQTSTKNAKACDRVAIVVYKVKDGSKPVVDGRPALMTKSITIQSPVLVGALKGILGTLGTFLEAHESANFHAPFKPLYFAYDTIMDLYDRTYNDTLLKEHLHLLTDLMNDLFGTMMTRVRNLRQSGLICYELAWTYFPKGSTIYCGAKDCEQLVRVKDTEYDKERGLLKISCEEMAFNGTDFAWRSTSLDIPAFESNVPVTSLTNYPLSFHPKAELVKARMIARGKLVLDYQELRYREYNGVAKIVDGCLIKRHNVSKLLSPFSELSY